MKTVIITGAAGGLGRALADEFYQKKYNLVLLDIDLRKLQSIKKTYNGRRVLAIRCDITNNNACKQAVHKTLRKFGNIDVLVNNAGVSHRSLFVHTDSAVIKRTMEINFFGSLNMTSTCMSHLLASKGSIIGIASVAGFGPLLGRTGYCASKYAMRGFFDTLRAELNGQVHVLMVYPSFIKTDLENNASDGKGAALRGRKRANIGKPLAPAYTAKKIVKALHKRKTQLFLSKVARMAWFLTRFFPACYLYFMKKKTKQEFA